MSASTGHDGNPNLIPVRSINHSHVSFVVVVVFSVNQGLNFDISIATTKYNRKGHSRSWWQCRITGYHLVSFLLLFHSLRGRRGRRRRGRRKAAQDKRETRGERKKYNYSCSLPNPTNHPSIIPLLIPFRSIRHITSHHPKFTKKTREKNITASSASIFVPLILPPCPRQTFHDKCPPALRPHLSQKKKKVAE